METTRVSLLLRIPELSKTNVKMLHPEKVCDKIRKILEDGSETLQMVFDFDQTITKYSHDGKTNAGSFELIVCFPGVSESFISRCKEQFTAHYKTISNTKLKNDEKLRILEEIYSEIDTLIKQIPIKDASDLEQLITKSNIVPRDGVKTTFKMLEDSSIPITILSAGLIYGINALLKSQDIYYDKVNIIANSFEFKDGFINGFERRPINVLTKSISHSHNKTCIEEFSKATNIILVGDLMSDANMADCVPESSNVLKVGFYNGKVDDPAVDDFQKVFDIVICDDDTMDVLNGVIKFVLSSKV